MLTLCTLCSAVMCWLQRGDAEMSQKLWRVVRSCVELGGGNPLVQIHDQGAGGNCNVVKEIIYPLGGEIDVRAVKVSFALFALEVDCGDMTAGSASCRRVQLGRTGGKGGAQCTACSRLRALCWARCVFQAMLCPPVSSLSCP